VIVAVYSSKPNNYLSVADNKGQERAEDAKGPQNNHTLIADDHPVDITKLFPEQFFHPIYHNKSNPIFPESSFNIVEGEDDLYPPYMPPVCNGRPKPIPITMRNAINILNR
jgi:hypothetical protein